MFSFVRRHPGRLTGGLAVLLLPALAAGQAPSRPSPAPDLWFPSQLDLVMVDVVVLDEKGDPVVGLQPEDFVIKEDGRVQAIASFEAVELPESAPTPSAVSRVVSTNAGRRTVPRSFAVVFDDAQMTPVSAERARKALSEFFRETLRDEDEVILASTATGTWWSTRAGEGREDLLAVLERLEGRRRADTSGSYISDYEAMRLALNRDPRIAGEVQRRFYEAGVILDPANRNAAESQQALGIGEGQPLVRLKANEAYAGAKQRNQASLRTLVRLGEALEAGRGRKSVFLVSDGFVYDTSLPEFRSVLAAMARANAAIYFLDAQGLPGTGEHMAAETGRAVLEQDVQTFAGRARLEAEGAESVALDTGGSVFRRPSQLAEGMERIADESRRYYLLGYDSTNTRQDGKLRKIEVEVRRPGVKVRARKGYYPPGEERTKAAGSDLEPTVRQALDAPFSIGAIPLRMASYVFAPGPDGKTAVLLAADADPAGITFTEARGRQEAELDTWLVVTSRDTGESLPVERKVDLSLPPEVRARLGRTWVPMFRDLQLAPGAWQARFLVRDRKSGRMGSVRHAFEVPPAGQLRTSTPILTDTLQPAEGGQRPVPVARRTFPSGASLAYVFEVYGAARDEVAGAPRVVSRYEVRRADGTVLARTDPAPIPPGPRGEVSRQTAVPLQGVAPGDYEIVLTVRDQVTGRAVEVRDPFTVVAPSASPS